MDELLEKHKLLNKVEVVENNKQRHYYHVSINTKVNFKFKRDAKRMLKGENDTLPKIYCADTLVGCLLSINDISNLLFAYYNYGNDDDKVVKWLSLSKKEYLSFKDNIKNGAFIYGFKPDILLRVIDKKILPDLEKTNEHWIVPKANNDKVPEYKPIAKLFIVNNIVKNTDINKNKPQMVTLYSIECFEDIYFTTNTVFGKGKKYLFLLEGGFGDEEKYTYQSVAKKYNDISDIFTLAKLNDYIEYVEIDNNTYSKIKDNIAPNLFIKENSLYSKLNLFNLKFNGFNF